MFTVNILYTVYMLFIYIYIYIYLSLPQTIPQVGAGRKITHQNLRKRNSIALVIALVLVLVRVRVIVTVCFLLLAGEQLTFCP